MSFFSALTRHYINFAYPFSSYFYIFQLLLNTNKKETFSACGYARTT